MRKGEESAESGSQRKKVKEFLSDVAGPAEEAASPTGVETVIALSGLEFMGNQEGQFQRGES